MTIPKNLFMPGSTSVEDVRFGGERRYADELKGVISNLADLAPPQGERVRRQLMSRSLLLSEGMAPQAYAAARHCAEAFAIGAPVEIYQAAGAENAAMHFCTDPVLLEIQGRMLALLDEHGLRAIMGHEMGHFLAHGPSNPAGSIALAARVLVHSEQAPDALVQLARRLSMSEELTADRFGLLACGSLDAALRLGMVAVTGLPAQDLNWDTQAYLKQSCALVEDMLNQGETAQGSSHPEHSLRAWAQWQFSETEVYKQLTGQGPASRRLADVDAQLTEILGHPDIELDDAHVFEEPQPEVQECALAACVMVAYADDELHETETEAIEQVFAHLLPQWREYLNPELSFARFKELAPMLYSSGPRAQRALFMLLFHVTAADGEVAREEVAAILAIGDALGCPRLFQRLLISILGSEPIDDAQQVATEKAIPIEAETRQVERALRVFFRRARERGGSEVTARRLLRLTGASRYSESIRQQLIRAAEQEELRIEPALSEDLGTHHRLICTSSKATANKTQSVLDQDEATRRLHQTLMKLRDKLVSGDGRSPSVRLRDTRRGRSFDCHQLEHVSVGLAERVVELIRGESDITLVESEAAQSHEPSARCQRQLIELQREHHSRMEETGADELFLGTGFVAASINRYLLRAPLILHNVAIERSAARIRLKSRKEQSTIANQALLQTMARLAKKPWSDDLGEAADEAAAGGPQAMLAFLDSQGFRVIGEPSELQAFRNRNEEFESWLDDRVELENCAVLGLFPQSRSDLLHDYDQLLEQLKAGAPVGGILAAATHLLPTELKSLVTADAQPSAKIESGAVLPVIQADPVQRQVVEVARAEPALVVDGPPGTGKSQVIVNLICDALLRGEKVAVVCEKRAALDVVVNRMQGEGLRHLLALVHDVKDDRKDLYAQVVDRIETSIPADQQAPELLALHESLESSARPLRALREPMLKTHAGLSLGQALVLSSGIEGVPADVPASLADLAADQLPRLAEIYQQLQPQAPFWRADSIWLSPEPASERASFATRAATDMADMQQRLTQGHQARSAFDAAFHAANLPLDTATLKQVLALHATAKSVVSTQSEATQESQTQLVALYGLIGQHGIKPVESLAAAIEQFEQALLTAGVTANRDILQALAQGRPVLTELIQIGSQDTKHLVLLIANLKESGALTQAVNTCRKLWSTHADPLRAHPAPVRWEDSEAFEAALQLIRKQLGRWQRFFSLAWWSARSAFKAHVQLNWRGRQDVGASPAFVAELEQYRQAAACWKALDSVVAQTGLSQTPEDAAQATDLIRSAGAAQQQAETLRAADTLLSTLALKPLPGSVAAWTAWAERCEAMLKVPPALAALNQLRKQVEQLAPDLKLPVQSARFAPIKARAEILNQANRQEPAWQSLKLWPTVGDSAQKLIGLIDSARKLCAIEQNFAALKQAVAANQGDFPWLQLGTPAERWRRMQESFATDFDALVKADQRLDEARRLLPDSPTLLRTLAAQSGDEKASSQAWDALVNGCWARAVAERLIETHRVTTPANRLISELESQQARTCQQQHQASHDVVANAVIASQNDSAWFREPPPDKGARRTPMQSIKEAMLKEARKQRRLMPMRSFVRRYADQGLLDALPVWLLSPETIAQLFPREAVFDLVIIDEASQCTVETGLPVLMRAKRIVIAGDEHQMPPSNYFKASVDSDEAEEEDIPTDVMDAESLLVLARDRCRHRRLAWHYRCQFEELIAFSNHAIYEGDLKTIPATQSLSGPCAIEWHAVEDAEYEAGVNEKEAEAVVSLMHRLLREDAKSTVGVITFNLAQRRTVLDAIDRRCSEDAGFAEVYQRAASDDQLDQRPFVKNLENVQGDERDQIIFSLGHAPKQRVRKDGRGDWYVPARFGPLGQRGGERRLNVAASRAKQAIHIVSSFDPGLLSVANTRHEGPRLFKGFLEFCQLMAKGHRSEANRVLDGLRGASLGRRSSNNEINPHYVPLKVQLLLALEARGHGVELNVGSSDFRVDVAIADPKNPGKYALGLICDEGAGEIDAFEEHVHIPAVLGLRGWRLMRVNALDWGLQREVVLKRVTEALRP